MRSVSLRPLGDVVIVLASGRKLTLRNTVLSGYYVSAGGDAPRESWTINFGAMDFGEPGEKEGPKRSEYDYQSSL